MSLLSAFRLAFPFLGGLVLACSILLTRQYHCNSFIQPASFVNTPHCLPVIILHGLSVQYFAHAQLSRINTLFLCPQEIFPLHDMTFGYGFMSYHASLVLLVVVTGICGEIVYTNIDDLTTTASQLMSFSCPCKSCICFHY